MANAFSILHNYDTPVYSPDFNFINAALSFKQNNLNANRAKLQNLYDQFSALKVAKDVDQSYIEERLQQVRDVTNKYASMDLSDPNFASSLMGNMAQVLDDNVKTAILSTKKMQAEDAEWEDKRKNSPLLYSKTNHQYALSVLSDRQRYLTSKEVGDTYKGGADFFEFRDTTKKFMDNLPNMEKFLGAKYFQTGPQEGYFRTIDTYEYIDENRLRQATAALFDEKDNMQMQANAWAKYGQADDATLRGAFTTYMTPRIEDAKGKISAAETLYEKETNPEEKAKLKEELDIAKQTLSNMQSTTYDDILEKGGMQSVYTSLYKDEYLNSLVKPYAAPRLIDRKIDEEQKAELEFKLKLLTAEAAVLKSKKSTEAAGKGEQEYFWGDEKEVGSLKSRESKTSYALQEYNQAIGSFRKVKGIDENGNSVELGNLTANEMLQVGKVLRGTDLADKKTIELEVRGKKIKVNVAQNKEKLLEFKTYVLAESPAVKHANELTLQTMKKAERRLVSVSNYDNNQAIAQLPNLQKKFVKKNGKFVLEQTKDPDYIKDLLRKAKDSDLTEAEQLTVTMYSNYLFMVDPKVSEQVREQAFIANRKMLFDKVGDMQTIRSLPATLSEVEANFTPSGVRTKAQKTSAEIQALQRQLAVAKTPTQKQNIQQKIDSYQRLQTRLSLAKPLARGFTLNPEAMQLLEEDPYLSSIGMENVGGAKNVTAYIEELTKTLENQLGQTYEQSGLVPTNREVLFTEKQEGFDVLKALVGGQAVGTISIEMKLDEDKDFAPTGQAVLTYTPAKGKAPLTKKVSLSTLEKNGIPFEPGYRTPYNANYRYAPTIDLGTMKVSGEKATQAVNMNLETFSPVYIQDRIQQAAAFGQEYQEFVKQQLRAFRTGAISAKIVPNQETQKYDYILVDQNGKELSGSRIPGDRGEFSVTDAAESITGAAGLKIKNDLFANYIDKVINDLQEKTLYQNTEETIQQLLQ